MSLREANKTENRRKILDAARQLLREGGPEALSMRDLAERAQVSSRTPYNLFGSKTAVLLGLLDEPLQQLGEALPGKPGRSLLLDALGAVRKVYALYEGELDYFRGIYWGLMTSDHADVRLGALVRAREITLPLIQLAMAAGELRADADAETIAGHLVTANAGLLGLWGAGLLSGEELVAQVRRSMGLCFLEYCREDLATSIRRQMNAKGVKGR